MCTPRREWLGWPATASCITEKRIAPGLDVVAGSITLLQDRRGQIWAGGVTGLSVRATDGKWRRITERDGLLIQHIYFAVEDGKGIVWIGTPRGAFRFYPQGHVEPFTPHDGLASWELNEGAAWSDPNGNLWMGTINGLSQCRDAAEGPNPMPARTVIEAAELPAYSIDFPERLNLDWASRTVTFRLAILSFRNRNRIGYRARLGVSNTTGPKTPESLNRRGDIRLMVQSVNDSGVWSETASLPIHVEPPYWMTLWFRLLMVGFALPPLVTVSPCCLAQAGSWRQSPRADA